MQADVFIPDCLAADISQNHIFFLFLKRLNAGEKKSFAFKHTVRRYCRRITQVQITEHGCVFPLSELFEFFGQYVRKVFSDRMYD